MSQEVEYQTHRLDHLGVVAGVCKEVGIAEWLDKRAGENRCQLAQTEQTVPNQVNKPTKRPTMRWIFQCFEGIDLLHIRMGSRWQTQVLGLQSLHQRILRLLGSTSSQCSFFSP